MREDWEKVKELDKKYYLHMAKAEEEYTSTPISKAEGSFVYTPDGKRLLDFSSQYVCVNIGHRNPKIQEAIKEAADRYGFVAEGFCTDYRSRASQLIMEDLLGPDDWAGRLRFLNTGSEAVEAALIMARLFTNRPNIVTREYAYHGWTQGAGACTRLRQIRNSITTPEPSSQDFAMRDVPGFSQGGYYVAPAPICYRCSLGYEYPHCKLKDGKLACVFATERLIKTIGPETVAAIITDIVSGGGIIFPPPEYTPQIREMTKELDILWIDDEIICGFGRLGIWFGYQLYEGVKPDLMTIAKGVSSSALPVSGIVINREIAEFFEKYRFWSLSTFAGHPLAMAALVANIEAMIEMDIPQMAHKAGLYLGDVLQELASNHPCVGLVNGRGLWWCMELVRDKASKEPFVKEDRYHLFNGDIKSWPSSVIKDKCVEKGVLVGSFIPNTLRLAPPLTIARAEIDQAIEVLDSALSEVDKLIIE